MTTRKMILLCAGVLVAFGASAADTFSWTGAAGDHKWSTPGNWLKGGAATETLPAPGDTVKLYPRCGETVDTQAIEVDVEGVKIANLQAGDADNAATAVTLTGQPIELTAEYPLDAYAVTTISNAVTFTRNGDMKVRSGKNIYLRGAITLACTRFLFRRDAGGLDIKTYGFTGQLYLYGDVTGPDTTIASGGNNMTCYIYGRVTCKVLESGINNCNGYIRLYATGNDCPSGKVHYFGGLYADVAYAFPTNMVISWVSEYPDWGAATEPFEFSTDQIVDRVSKPTPTTYNGVNVVRSAVSGSGNATLTLRATASAVAYARFNGAYNLVYDPVSDDYSQTMMDLNSTISGKLTVRGGTFASAGTNTFSALTSIAVENKGILDISSSNAVCSAFNAVTSVTVKPQAKIRISSPDAKAFNNTKAVAELQMGATIEVCAGATAGFKQLFYAGVPVSAGTYTADGASGTIKADWVTGAGQVTVAGMPTDVTCWLAPKDGNWTDAANWSAGVPTASLPARITAEGVSDYTVTVDSAITAPKGLILRNLGSHYSKIRVAEGGVWKLSGQVESYSVARGGELKIDGGYFALTNCTGTFTVSGEGVVSGKVTVASGTFSMARKVETPMYIQEGGLLSGTGGLVESRRLGGNYASIRNAGGRMDFSSTALFRSCAAGEKVYNYYRFGTGLTEFGGSSTNQQLNSGSSSIGIAPNAAGETAEVVFRDQSVWTGSTDSFWIGAVAGGRAILTLDAPLVRGTAASPQAFGYTTLVGCNAGYGELKVLNGTAKSGDRGTIVGGSSSKDNKSAGTEGRLTVDGGTYIAGGGVNTGWGKQQPMGLTAGYGAFTAVTSGRPYTGIVTVASGALKSSAGHNVIGAGYGYGRLTQTGGETRLTAYGLMAGLCGGIGEVFLSGGTFEARGASYIGGCFTNQFVNIGCTFVSNGNYPISRHGGTGLLQISGGTFDAAYNANAKVTVGMEGDGVIEMVGSEGVFKTSNLVCSNSVIDVGLASETQTHSTLKFTADAAGVAPLKATKATLTPGTKVVIDLTACADRTKRFKVIDSADITADVATLQLEATADGAPISEMRLFLRANGLYAAERRGSILVVR